MTTERRMMIGRWPKKVGNNTVAFLDDDQQEGPMTDERRVCETCDGEGVIETQPLSGIDASWPTGAPRIDEEDCPACGGTGQDDALRAAVLRYGRALARIRGRAGSIVDAAGYDEWCAALEVLDALALALAAEEGPA